MGSFVAFLYPLHPPWIYTRVGEHKGSCNESNFFFACEGSFAPSFYDDVIKRAVFLSFHSLQLASFAAALFPPRIYIRFFGCEVLYSGKVFPPETSGFERRLRADIYIYIYFVAKTWRVFFFFFFSLYYRVPL